LPTGRTNPVPGHAAARRHQKIPRKQPRAELSPRPRR
jgi:hypothetical protein